MLLELMRRAWLTSGVPWAAKLWKTPMDDS